jgi:hypothetical protein
MPSVLCQMSFSLGGGRKKAKTLRILLRSDCILSNVASSAAGPGPPSLTLAKKATLVRQASHTHEMRSQAPPA